MLITVCPPTRPAKFENMARVDCDDGLEGIYVSGRCSLFLLGVNRYHSDVRLPGRDQKSIKRHGHSLHSNNLHGCLGNPNQYVGRMLFDETMAMIVRRC